MNVIRRFGAPVTAAVIVGMVVAFLAAFFGARLGILASGDPSAPWGFLTYPFSQTGDGQGLLFLIIEFAIFGWIGGSLERSLGILRYGLTLLGLVAAGSLAVFLAGFAGGTTPLRGIDLPLAALTVLWGLQNRTARIMIWGIIPLSGLWLAMLSAGLLFFSYGTGNPVRGVMALVPCGIAWALAVYGVPGDSPVVAGRRPSRAWQESEDRILQDAAKRRIEREENERLRKLLGE